METSTYGSSPVSTHNALHRGDRPLPRIDFEFAQTSEERNRVWDANFTEMAFSPMERIDGVWHTLPTESVRIFLQLNPQTAHFNGNDPKSVGLYYRLADECRFRNALAKFINDYFTGNREAASRDGFMMGAWSTQSVAVCRVEEMRKVERNNRSWMDCPTDIRGQMTFDYNNA